MSKLDNVSVVTLANVFFDGKCVSHTVISPDGKRRSVGVILPSTLTFETKASEVMQIEAGRCRVKLAGQAEAKEYGPGTSFAVDAGSSFEIEAIETVHYICHFGSAAT